MHVAPGLCLEKRREAVQPLLQPDGVGLHHERVAETVHDETRQPVALGMNQPVEGRVMGPCAQVQRGLQLRAEPVVVDQGIRVPVQHPEPNARLHRGHAHAQRRAFRILENDQHARRDVARPPVEHEIIGPGPGMAMADAARVGLGA